MVKQFLHRELDVRFPTNAQAAGTDSMNTECDYSAAYVELKTESAELTASGMTFTIGRGNELVCAAITLISERIKGKKIEELFKDMGKTWDFLVSDPQLRWIGPEKVCSSSAVSFTICF